MDGNGNRFLAHYDQFAAQLRWVLIIAFVNLAFAHTSWLLLAAGVLIKLTTHEL